MPDTETPQRIEPCLLQEYPSELTDLVAELAAATATLGVRLHPASAASLAGMVRVMNCYYSNLIEGHNTRPRDIERALADDLDGDERRRDLQLEARSHIEVQREVDELTARGEYGEPASEERVRWLHRRFYDEMPASFLRLEHPEGDFEMVPGHYRSEPRHDNAVGRHVPPSSVRIVEFMRHFESRYRFAGLGKGARITAMAAAHHRLNYIHPFPDGNGRVSRLMSHAMAAEAGIGAHGLWSISRGLARGLADAGEYKRMMDLADSPRRGDLDGRGNLSLEALVEFVTWFCAVSLDQVKFMGDMFDLDRLDARLEEYILRDLRLSPQSAALAREVLRVGEIERGEAARITGYQERAARKVLGGLVDAGLLASRTPKGPVRLRFGTLNVDALFPRLFPAQAGA